jgi:heat shock protein HtpX
MNKRFLVNQKYKNLMHTTLILLMLAALLGGLGWTIAGTAGLQFALVLSVASYFLTPRVPAHLIMLASGARPVSLGSLPQLHRIAGTLSQRAGLATMPRLYYHPSARLNAFAAGTPEDAAICVSRGLLSVLNLDEIAGVMGHEISHIRNNDMKVMGFAALFGRLTQFASLAGQLILLFSLPLILLSDAQISFVALALLIFAPALSTVLQFTLSRTREFNADLGSAFLTGNPLMLASALNKLEVYRRQGLKRFFRLVPDRGPVWLNTHPSTGERIRRLMDYVPGRFNKWGQEGYCYP